MRSMPTPGPEENPEWGNGQNPLADDSRRKSECAPRQIVLVEMAEELPQPHKTLLEGRFRVIAGGAFPANRQALDRLSELPVLLTASRFAVAEALGLVRALRRAGSSQPIVLFGEHPTRSSDRVRALCSGADDFLSAAASAEELLLKLELHMARDPHTSPRPDARSLPTPEVLDFRQPAGATGEPALLSSSAFLSAVGRHIEVDETPLFTLIRFRTRRLPTSTQRQFTRLLMRQVRRSERDLVGESEEGLAVYLHGMGRRDTRQFLGRLLVRWAGTGGMEVGFTCQSYPSQSKAVLELLRNRAASHSRSRSKSHSLDPELGPDSGTDFELGLSEEL